MATYTFTGAIAWNRIGQFVTSGPGKTSTYIKDPSTGNTPTGLTQGGVSVTQITTTAFGGYAFTTTDVLSVVINFGAGDFVLYANELGNMLLTAAAPSNTAIDNRVKWQPSTGYALGQQVISPNNDVVKANVAHTSSSAFATDVAKWDQSERVINIHAYGAVGDGTTDETAAFNAAIAAANATAGNDRGNITGICFDLGNGRYKLPTALNPITVSGVSFRGASPESTTLLMSAGAATFTYGDSSLARTPVNFALTDLKVEYLADPVAGAAVLKVDNGFGIKLRNLELVRIGTLVSAGVSATRQCGGIQVSGVKGSVGNVGLPLFDLKFGSGLDISNMQMFVWGVLAPVHPAAMTTVSGTNVFNCVAGKWDTVQCSGARFERFYSGLFISAGSGMVYQDFFFTNTVMDYIRTTCIYAESLTGGVVTGINVDSACWFTSWESHNLLFTGVGYHDMHDVSGVLPISGIAALRYTIVAKTCRFQLNVGANSRASADAAAVVFVGGAKGFILEGSRGNDDLTSAGLPWRNDWGVQIGSDCDNFLIQGNRFAGAAGGAYNTAAAHTAGSAKRLAQGNTADGYHGYSGYGGAFSLAASTVANTNKTAHVWEVSIFGGTVTVIAKNGTTITGMTAGTLRIEPGDTFTVTYSVAPTVSRFVMA